MTPPEITTLDQLYAYLDSALQLEHATIPPYLTAMYSIQPGTNSDAYHVFRVTAVEEMLHLTLVANVLNAVGGSPDLTVAGFVPDYPAYLPDGESDFQVSRRSFSRECVEMCLEIERPRQAHDENSRLIDRGEGAFRLGAAPDKPQMQFYSIGEFYREISMGLHYLHEQLGDALFEGDPARQVTNEYFYSGGGSVVRVTDLKSALAAIDLICEQGEGFGGGIYDTHGELAHYYRFQQLVLGRYYQQGDAADHPTGPPVQVDWDAAFPIKQDVHLADLPNDSALRDAALEFNKSYAEFLGLLTRAYSGHPDVLLDAVADMFRLRDQMTRLIHNPIPGLDRVNAAPTFEITPRVPAVAS